MSANPVLDNSQGTQKRSGAAFRGRRCVSSQGFLHFSGGDAYLLFEQADKGGAFQNAHPFRRFGHGAALLQELDGLFDPNLVDGGQQALSGLVFEDGGQGGGGQMEVEGRLGDVEAGRC